MLMLTYNYHYFVSECAIGVIYLIIVDQLLFNDLHGIDALRLLQLHQQHLGIAASTDHPQ